VSILLWEIYFEFSVVDNFAVTARMTISNPYVKAGQPR